jgi:hypothetical protein
MQDDGQVRTIRKYIAAYNAFDVDGMLALLSPGVRFENWSGGSLTAEASGIDAFAQLANHAKAVFSEREQRVTAIEQGADAVLVHVAYRGVLAADVPDGPCAGTVLDLAGTSEFAFEDGLIARIVDRS